MSAFAAFSPESAMAGEWPTRTFADLIGGPENVIGGPFGSNLTQADYVDDGVPVVRGSNMEQFGRYIGGEFAYVSKQKAETLLSNQILPGDIVVTQRGTLGQVSLVPLDPKRSYVVSQSQMGVRVNGADARFDYYLLKSSVFKRFLQGSTIQTGVPHINMGLLRGWRVVCPPYRDRVCIADTLSAFDEKIELNRRMAETLESMARSLFKSWFVDFDPVRAKAEGRPTGLSDDLAALFPDRFDDDGLPLAWRSATLEELAHLNPEAWTRNVRPPFIEYVDLSNTKLGVIEATQTFRPDEAPSRAQRVLRPGDTIVGTVRPGNNS